MFEGVEVDVFTGGRSLQADRNVAGWGNGGAGTQRHDVQLPELHFHPRMVPLHADVARRKAVVGIGVVDRLATVDRDRHTRSPDTRTDDHPFIVADNSLLIRRASVQAAGGRVAGGRKSHLPQLDFIPIERFRREVAAQVDP